MDNGTEGNGSMENAGVGNGSDVWTNATITIEDLNERMIWSLIPVLVFIALLSIIGIAGNLTVLVIYTKRYPKCNFKYFVLILAGIDIVSCIVLMPLEIVTFVHWFTFPSAILCKAKSALNAYTVTASASSLLLIAIDRFRKVCKPHSKQIKPEVALKLTAFVLGLSAIPAISDGVFWGLHTHAIHYKGANLTAFMCEKDDLFKDTVWPMLHTTVLYTGCNVVVMAATLTLYIFIARKLFCDQGPILTPEIKVTSPDIGAEGSVFKFDKHIPMNNLRSPNQSGSDIETGISDSEYSVGSLGKLSDDVITENNSADTTDGVSTVHKQVQIEEPPPQKHVKKSARISLEVTDNDDESSTGHKPALLVIPDVDMRPKRSLASPRPSSTPSPDRYRRRRSTIHSIKGRVGTKLRRKTLIMFILTATFIATTLTYLAMISHMADSGNFLKAFSVPERTAWFFFLRLYFINSVINPLLYGFLDTRFRQKLWDMGIHVRFLAGSIKRNLGESIRRSNSGRSKTDVNLHVVHQPWRERPRRPKSSTTVSD